jgi:hypothetical protein
MYFLIDMKKKVAIYTIWKRCGIENEHEQESESKSESKNESKSKENVLWVSGWLG